MSAQRHDFDTVSSRRRYLLLSGLAAGAVLLARMPVGATEAKSAEAAESADAAEAAETASAPAATDASIHWVLSGQVRSAKGANPIAGARVEAWLCRDQHYVTQSDADGRFLLKVCASGNDESIHLLSYRVSGRGLRSVAKNITHLPTLASALTTNIRDTDGVFRSAVGIALIV